MYTNNTISDNFQSPQGNQRVADVIFQGDSRQVLRDFPDGIKEDLGYALYQLELGQTPPDRKPVRTVGPGVYELRESDASRWYRILYERRGPKVHVLHCFTKQSNAIEQKDIDVAKARRSRVLEAEREEKRNVKRSLHTEKRK